MSTRRYLLDEERETCGIKAIKSDDPVTPEKTTRCQAARDGSSNREDEKRETERRPSPAEQTSVAKTVGISPEVFHRWNHGLKHPYMTDINTGCPT